MRKRADQGCSILRDIFRAILIVGIATGMNSATATSVNNENNNDANNAGEISLKRLNFTMDEMIQQQDYKTIAPRGLSELRSPRHRICPVCQSTSKISEVAGYDDEDEDDVTSFSGSRHYGGGSGRVEHHHSDDEDDDDDGHPKPTFSHEEDEEYHAINRKAERRLRLAEESSHDDFVVNVSRNPNYLLGAESAKAYGGARRYESGGYKNGLSGATGGKLFGVGGYSLSESGGDTRSPHILRRIGGRRSYGRSRGQSFEFNHRLEADDEDSEDAINRFQPGAKSFSMRFRDTLSPTIRRRLVIDSSNKSGFMYPNDAIDSVEELVNDPSLFYVTFACQPKVGKYICKLQCAKRKNGMTGTCESGYCTCIFKEEKKMRKKMNKRFMAAMHGFKTDCSTGAKHCKRFCKALTPDKSFTGICADNICKCVTYPHNPDKKKTACQKAIKKLQKMEDMALSILGAPPDEDGPSTDKLNASTGKIMNNVMASQSVEGCTPEDYENLRGIINNLKRRLKFAKRSGAKTSAQSSKSQPQETLASLSTTPRSWETHHAGTKSTTDDQEARGLDGP